ncbi:hypothetical protein [Formosa haliotis]|uniref:hypothetical protein n=1 Tax=Formosa haliotis TaxID=1555194 RepID=UPI000826AB80|nr:hypothetical protein [Formosa haliotis]
MNNNLVPKYTQSVSESIILWFETSNQYTVVANGLFHLIQIYFNSESKNQCIKRISQKLSNSTEEAEPIFDDLDQFIKDQNKTLEHEVIEDLVGFTNTQRHMSRYYSILDQTVKVYFQSELLLNYIHPQLVHLEISDSNVHLHEFDIYEDDRAIKLYRDERFVKSFPKAGFHFLQGKFAMELICALYNKKEHDWIGMFHASTVSNTKEAVMIIGTSGSGKSTLTSLLANSGLDLVADDTTPILRDDLNTYYYPAGISVKQGAFNALEQIVPNFDKLKENHLYKYKGTIKYVPTKRPIKTNLPCKTIVLVKYKKNSETILEPCPATEALEILIPDSWISPHPENAKAFLEWISTVTFYKLTYSNNQEAIDIFSTIFNKA